MSQRRFIFGLERVRDLRVHDERRAKEDLGRSLAARANAGDELLDARSRLVAARATIGPGQHVSAEQLLARERFAVRTADDVARAATSLDTSEAALVTSRAALLDAGRARETLDRLRARRLSEHTQEGLRRETSALDEIALRSHGRGARSAA